jgi:CBS domain-containing protein
MSDDVFYCYDDQDCSEIARNMAELQVRRLPVVNRDKRLVGTVSLGDLERGGADAEAHLAHAGITRDI